MPPSLSILGTGPASLASSHLLSSLHPTLYRLSDLPPPSVDVGVGIWSTALALLPPAVAADLADRGAFVTAASYRSTSGRLLHSTTLASTELLFLPTSDLMEVLSAAVAADSNVTVADAGGYDADAEGQITVDCTGLRSPLRAALHPEATVVSEGYTVYRGTAPTGTVESFQTWGREKRERFAVVPLSGSRSSWFATVATESGGSAGGVPESGTVKRNLLARFRSWHSPIPSLIESTPSSSILTSPATSLSPFAPASTTVAFVGDARAAADPVLAQGITVAIEDAAALAKHYVSPPLPPAAFLFVVREGGS